MAAKVGADTNSSVGDAEIVTETRIAKPNAGCSTAVASCIRTGSSGEAPEPPHLGVVMVVGCFAPRLEVEERNAASPEPAGTRKSCADPCRNLYFCIGQDLGVLWPESARGNIGAHTLWQAFCWAL